MVKKTPRKFEDMLNGKFIEDFNERAKALRDFFEIVEAIGKKYREPKKGE